MVTYLMDTFMYSRIGTALRCPLLYTDLNENSPGITKL